MREHLADKEAVADVLLMLASEVERVETDIAAVIAALQWRFSPTFLGGKPVKVAGTIAFNFKHR